MIDAGEREAVKKNHYDMTITLNGGFDDDENFIEEKKENFKFISSADMSLNGERGHVVRTTASSLSHPRHTFIF
jgi:hypothetical protein